MPINQDAREAVALLQRLLVLVPPAGSRDTATRQRIEGAAIALQAISDGHLEQSDPFV
jgi:hypothetical protein